MAGSEAGLAAAPPRSLPAAVDGPGATVLATGAVSPAQRAWLEAHLQASAPGDVRLVGVAAAPEAARALGAELRALGRALGLRDGAAPSRLWVGDEATGLDLALGDTAPTRALVVLEPPASASPRGRDRALDARRARTLHVPASPPPPAAGAAPVALVVRGPAGDHVGRAAEALAALGWSLVEAAPGPGAPPAAIAAAARRAGAALVVAARAAPPAGLLGRLLGPSPRARDHQLAATSGHALLLVDHPG